MRPFFRRKMIFRTQLPLLKRSLLDRFAKLTKTAESHEGVMQGKRQLQVAFEFFEHGDDVTGAQTLQEVEELFRKARRFIAVSDK